MANYNLEFSFAVEVDEEQHGRELVSLMHRRDAISCFDPEQNLWTDAEPPPGCLPWDPPSEDELAACSHDCDAQLEGRKVFIYSQESGDVEAVIDVLQQWLRRYPQYAPLGFTWACTCDKPRVDSFDGGAAFLTADTCETLHASQWLSQQLIACNKPEAPHA